MFKSKSKQKPKKIIFSDIDVVKKRFLLLNKERLRRGEECMRSNQHDFLDFLPLLFHINHPSLPGYISKGVPAGICDYAPTDRALKAANKYIHRFTYKKRALARYDILSMFLMGSSGTIAYSKKSDFDIWLCHQPDLAQKAIDDLQAKATVIEEWAGAQGLEVHFFLMNADDFKAGKIVDLSSESSGTAQYYLLLEEFYRTGLLIAGRFPVWWLVPVEEEANYDAYVTKLYKHRVVLESECIDFGGIPTLPTEEFFGAAVWQLFKGIDSPYKSVLKLLLMEVYASGYPDISLLCLGFKKAIFSGENDLDKLDPYLMLYNKLEEYLLARDEPDRLELVRRCFYFKVNQKLGQTESVQYDWRRDLLRSMVNAWGWEREYLTMLDNRGSWKIKQVLQERGVLVKELTYTYQFLSAFAREHAQLAAINQHDLNALGRKLYAAFERKAGKIEIVNRGISQDVYEPALTLYQIRQKGHDGGWALLGTSENSLEANDMSSMVALKRGQYLIELLAWGVYNGLLTASTLLKVIRHSPGLESRELIEFVKALNKAIPVQYVLETHLEDLSRASRVLQSVVVINMSLKPSTDRRRADIHLASNRTDAFSYGGLYENLIDNADQILLTSWKEVITTHYEGEECIFAYLGGYFSLTPPSKGVKPPRPTVLCYMQNHAYTIKLRIEKLFDRLVECFYSTDENQYNRYVLCVGRAYYVLYMENDVLRQQRLESYEDMLEYLAQGRQGFGHVVMDENIIADSMLSLVFRFNKPGVIQFFYKREAGKIDIFIIDENGSLHCQQAVTGDDVGLIDHYNQFFNTILRRRTLQLAEQLPDEAGDEVKVEYYNVARNRQGRYQVSRKAVDHTAEARYINVQVIAAQDDTQSVFSLYCDGHEFSSLELGDKLFDEAAVYIVSKRDSHEHYSVYITDVDLAPTMEKYSGQHVPIVEALNYKRDIETKLNLALESLHQIQQISSN